MKKILSLSQIRQADQYTIEQEPVSSTDLMERAATACYTWIREHASEYRHAKVICGMGNNGGDGLVIARRMAADGWNVTVMPVRHASHESDDFKINLERLRQQNLANIIPVNKAEDLPEIQPGDLVLDAMLGSGITKPAEGLLKEVIMKINPSGAFILSIDMPSGLNCEQAGTSDPSAVVHATHTLTFEVPRLGFMFSENERYIGNWTLIPIGLHPEAIRQSESNHYLIEDTDVAPAIHYRQKFAHKGHFGHGFLVSGSYGKMGAAILGTRAALRTGIGLVTTHIPTLGYGILQTAVPEGMTSIDPHAEHCSLLPDLSAYNAIAMGPGIGTHDQTATCLKLLIQNYRNPLILDADALNILGINKTWLPFLPANTILTPHVKEFERISHKVYDSKERLSLQLEISRKYQVYIILKGAFSSITTPDGRCFFNSSGNPGMATAGSGDVLTGILLGLAAQGYSPLQVCLIGTYLHGLAGDLAADSLGEEALNAGDLVEAIPHAYLHLKSIR